MSDTWVATDALGRSLPGPKDCPAPRAGRTVGIFYFLWLGQHGQGGPYDITKILQHPKDSRPWGPPGRFHHWGQPELGYYISTDPYVFRRHAAMLTQAGVDVVFLDVTNGFTYDKPRDVLCQTWRQMRTEGHATPQIAFLANSSHQKVVQHLYRTFYQPGQFKELWFRWQGKPLMLAPTDGLDEKVRAFFTLRRSWAWSKTSWFGDGRDRWPWLDHTPQRGGWHERGTMEQIPVAVAEHPVSSIGRSYSAGRQPPANALRTDEGVYFAEQWRRALQVDPPVVFVTGWNEWVAQRFLAKRARPFAGGRVQAGETYFVDQYNREYSRDIEPMAGGHTDSYYYQLVGFVRRYKGARPVPKAGPPKTLRIDGRFDDWAGVAPEYRDASGDTAHRDHPGWGSVGRLVDKTGRNDFVTLQVADDATHVYFHARTRQALTPSTDPHWMELYIDADANMKTGWEGYDFVVNRRVLGATRTLLQRLERDGTTRKVGEVSYAVRGKDLELAVPKKMLGLAGRKTFTLDFHWADNIQAERDIIEFARHGDSAPDRRFKYRYIRE